MKRLILLSAVILMFLSSCNKVMFRVPQPMDGEVLKEFPKDLSGTYIDKDNDSIVLQKNSFKFAYKGSKESKFESLDPGKIVLKKLNDYFVLSMLDEDSKNWQVYIANQKGKDLVLSLIDLNNDNDKNNETKIIKILKEITRVTEIKNDKGDVSAYLINPTNKEFELMITRKIFSGEIEFKRLK